MCHSKLQLEQQNTEQVKQLTAQIKPYLNEADRTDTMSQAKSYLHTAHEPSITTTSTNKTMRHEEPLTNRLCVLSNA